MKKKSLLLLLLPTALFPYSFFGIFAIFGATEKYISQEVGAVVFGSLLVACFLMPIVCNTLFIAKNEDDPRTLLKISLIVKIIHIPSYVLIFIFGLLAGLMIFMTLPLIIMLVIFDYITLMFSGMISIFSLSKNMQYDRLLYILCIILQFVFCVDVISLIVLNVITKDQKNAAEIPCNAKNG